VKPSGIASSSSKSRLASNTPMKEEEFMLDRVDDFSYSAELDQPYKGQRGHTRGSKVKVEVVADSFDEESAPSSPPARISGSQRLSARLSGATNSRQSSIRKRARFEDANDSDLQLALALQHGDDFIKSSKSAPSGKRTKISRTIEDSEDLDDDDDEFDALSSLVTEDEDADFEVNSTIKVMPAPRRPFVKNSFRKIKTRNARRVKDSEEPSDSDLSMLSRTPSMLTDDDEDDEEPSKNSDSYDQRYFQMVTDFKKENRRKPNRFEMDNIKLNWAHPGMARIWDDLKNLPVIPKVQTDQPSFISRKLKPFQLEGLHWMIEQEKTKFKGGLLADEMGMGKTIQAVSLIMSDYPAKTPTLVLVPPVALMQWQSEIAEYTDGRLKVLVYHGAKKSSAFTPRDLQKTNVVLMTCEFVSVSIVN
jgi:DNA repair protein RAD16